MMEKQYDYDKLLTKYFLGKLTSNEKLEFEKWKDASNESLSIYNEAEKVWRSLDLLHEMKTYNSSAALSKVNASIGRSVLKEERGILYYWQRVAAILLLPLLIVSGIYFFVGNQRTGNELAWQTITTPPGVKSQAELPDGTKVWLNSGSSLKYPATFSGKERNVQLEGEAFFDVAKDKGKPFFVNLGKIGIEVVGTTFNIINHGQEEQIEVVLASGKIKLYRGTNNKREILTEMNPGDGAIFDKPGNKLSIKSVDTEKYTSWINGRLVFRDDVMVDVARKLGRWYNIEIEIADADIANYVYTATFKEESIEQVLDLLKRTSPIEYSMAPAKRLDDGSFEKQHIILKKRYQ